MKKAKKKYIFNSIFIHFIKLKMLTPYLESTFYVYVKNGITIEFYAEMTEKSSES